MRKLAILAAVALAALCFASAAQAKTLRVHVNIPNQNVFTNPPDLFTQNNPPPGAYTFAGIGSVDGPSNNDGDIHFHGIATGQNTSLITAVFRLRNGHLTVNGVGTDANDIEEYAVTGGTRKYRGAVGDAVLSNEQSSDGQNGSDQFDFTFKYTTVK